MPPVRRIIAVGPWALAALTAAGMALAGPPTRRGPVDLRPSSQPASQPAPREFDQDDWHYRMDKAATPEGGVPWELTVTPIGEQAAKWKRGELNGAEGAAAAIAEMKTSLTAGARVALATPKTPSLEGIPVIHIPDIVWKGWMAKDLQDVVGIHFHELVTDDSAKILFTLHQIPPVGPDGQPPKDYKGPKGARLEATLLAPLTFHLDQSVAVREDKLKPDLAVKRGEHELGHAEVSQDALLAAMAGPQDWKPAACTGRKSKLVYYWKRERFGRAWEGYRDRDTKLLSARTTVVVVPPTRWSMMLPVPIERVTQKQMDAFNEAIVLTPLRFGQIDATAQAKFHAEHGAYEQGEAGK